MNDCLSGKLTADVSTFCHTLRTINDHGMYSIDGPRDKEQPGRRRVQT